MREEMTREQAITELSILLNEYQDTVIGDAIDMGITTLEAEPCEDSISRQEAIDAFSMFAEYESNRTNAEWVDRIRVVLSSLPPVQPSRPTGHWIYTGWVCQTDEILYGYACSECGGISFFRKYDNKILGGKWCHCCGADMRESEEQA